MFEKAIHCMYEYCTTCRSGDMLADSDTVVALHLRGSFGAVKGAANAAVHARHLSAFCSSLVKHAHENKVHM